MKNTRFGMILFVMALSVFLALSSLLLAGNAQAAVWGLSESVSVPEVKAASGFGYIAMPFQPYLAFFDVNAQSISGTIDLSAYNCYNAKLAIEPDGENLWVSCAEHILVIERATNAIVHVADIFYAGGSISFRMDGQQALVLGAYDQIHVVNTESYTVTTVALEDIDNSSEIVNHPYLPLSYLLAGYDDDPLAVFDNNTLTVEQQIFAPRSRDLVLAGNGSRLYVSSSGASNDGISVIDTVSNEQIEYAQAYMPLHLALDPLGEKLFYTGDGSSITSVDTANMDLRQVLQLDYWSFSSPSWMAPGCDGEKLFVTNATNYSGQYQLAVVDLATFSLDEYIQMPDVDGDGLPETPGQLAVCPQVIASGVVQSPSNQTKSGARGHSVTYTETVVNATGVTDTFTLLAGSRIWDTDLSSSTTGSLSPWEKFVYNVTVDVPADVSWYSTETVVVTVTSVASPTIENLTSFTTRAYASSSIDVSPGALTSVQMAGTVVTQTMFIGNGNGVTLTFGISETVHFPASPRILAWTKYTDYQMEYQNILEAIGTFTDYELEETNTLDPIELAEALSDVDVFLLPPQNYLLPPYQIGVSWASTLQNFVQNGGTVVQLGGLNDALLLDGAGLLNVTWGGGQSIPLEVLVPSHPLVNGLPASFTIPDGYEYTEGDGQALLSPAALNVKDIGSGHVVLLGFRFNQYNAYKALLLANSVRWYGDVRTTWLTEAPEVGFVSTNDMLPISVTFQAIDAQPGEYTTTLLINSNDVASPVVAVPVTMTVTPTASMGWVEGYVTDSRSGMPLHTVVRVNGQSSETQTSPLTGYYRLWLEAGNYLLTVDETGYLMQSASVTITAQQANLRNFSLVRDLPILQVAPDRLNVAFDFGESATRTITVTNDGPATLTITLHEQEAPKPVVRILAWTKYAGYYEYYTNTLQAIGQFTPYHLVETNETNPTSLAAQLADTDVFLIPVQDRFVNEQMLFDAGVEMASALQDFTSAGGIIVATGNTTSAVIRGAALMDVFPGDGCNDFRVVMPEHPIVKGISNRFSSNYWGYAASFVASDAYSIVRAYYYGGANTSSGSDTYSVAPDSRGNVILAKDIGLGHVALIGYNFGMIEEHFAHLLANAVRWQGDSEIPWLLEEPVSATVPAYTSLPVDVLFASNNVQPGEYLGQLMLQSNDSVTSRVAIPLTLTVLSTQDMGRIHGRLFDRWNGQPMTGTVELVGVYVAVANPDYEIWGIAGTYSLTASAPGYLTTTNVVTISPGLNGEIDIELEPARARIGNLPSSLQVSLRPGEYISRAIVISNTGSLPLDVSFLEMEGKQTTTLNSRTPADLAGKRILYDRSHGGNEPYYYSTLISDLSNAGATITVNYRFPIDEATLNSYDILWLNNWSREWLSSELSLLARWMRKGGALLLHGSYSDPVFGPPNILGLNYQGCGFMNTCPGTTRAIAQHEVTMGVDSVYVVSSPYYLEYAPGTWAETVITNTSNVPMAAAIPYGLGRAFVTTDTSFFDYVIQEEDNRLLAANVFDWLVGTPYTDVSWLSESPLSATIPAHSNLDVTLSFDARTLLPGVYNATLVVESNDLTSDLVYIPVTMTVVAEGPALSLLPETQQGEAAAGETVVYTLTVTNLGEAADTFALEANGVWTSTLSAATTALLDSGETFTFTVSVTLPVEAGSGEEEVVTVTATSSLDPTVNASAEIVTRMAIRRVYLPLIIRP